MVRNDKGEILFLKRTENCRNEPGKWTWPGGKLEFGETQEQTVKRETKEETGLEVEIVRILTIIDHLIPNESQHWFNPLYEARAVRGDARICEPDKCSEIAWFSPENLPAEMTVNLQEFFEKVKKKEVQI